MKIALSRPKNLRDILFRTKLPEIQNSNFSDTIQLFSISITNDISHMWIVFFKKKVTYHPTANNFRAYHVTLF